MTAGVGRPPKRQGFSYSPVAPSLRGVQWESVRSVSDRPKIEIDNALSEVFHVWWGDGKSQPWGGFDVVKGDSLATMVQFNQLSRLLELMSQVTFHYCNVSMGYPVPEQEYRHIRLGVPPYESYVDNLPLWIAEMDEVDLAIGKPTRLLRDAYIALAHRMTGVDLTGRF